MGYKNICFECRKAFNQGTDFNIIRKAKCPNCGMEMEQVTHHFRPPKQKDIKKWETAKYLMRNGFIYQHIYKIVGSGLLVKYPENMRDAKEFINKYKEQAIID